MFTKVVVGLVAAIAVAGAGVYYAQSDSPCHGGCPIQRMLDSGATTESTECPGCCKPASASTETPTDESLAAFTGSAAMKTSCDKSPAPHCCTEE